MVIQQYGNTCTKNGIFIQIGTDVFCGANETVYDSQQKDKLGVLCSESMVQIFSISEHTSAINSTGQHQVPFKVR